MIFRDAELQRQLDEKGYVKISLLDMQEVDHLMEYYGTIKDALDSEPGFHVSLDSADPEFIAKVQKKVMDTAVPKLNEHLDNAQFFIASYTIKETGNKFIVPPHQDWSFVDETKHYSCTIWIPLHDVNMENGALGIIPESHKLFNHPRPSPSPQAQSALAGHIFTLFPYVDIIDMKAGEALIFNNKLIHASPPNTTDAPRIAVGVGVTQADAQLLHYYQLPGTSPVKQEVYNVDANFYNEFNNKRLSDLYENGDRVTGYDSKEVIEKQLPELTKEQLEEMVTSIPDAKYNKELIDRLMTLFGYTSGGEQLKKQEEPETATTEPAEHEWKDDRTFFQKYTPKNIIAEIKWRLKGRK